MLGVFEPDYGHVLDTMVDPPGEPVELGELLQPKVEAELAFILARDLPTPCTVLDVLQATRLIVPALEIVDSRIADWKIRLPDTVADNASSARVVLGGRRRRPDELDLRWWAWCFERNGEMVATRRRRRRAGQPRRPRWPGSPTSWRVRRPARAGRAGPRRRGHRRRGRSARRPVHRPLRLRAGQRHAHGSSRKEDDCARRRCAWRSSGRATSAPT